MGSESSGAFAVDSITPTNFLGFSAQNKLGRNLNLFGYYVTDVSTPVALANSLFSCDISNITSSAYNVGLSYDGFERRDKSAGLLFSQPLHVDKGTNFLLITTRFKR